MTRQQARQRGFRPGAQFTRGSFRFPSNPTTEGYSSGYHEAAVTTDTFTYLRQATDDRDGWHTLAETSSAYFSGYGGDRVPSSTLAAVLEFADGFRTDTAQTILSGPDGTVTGHSHSGVDTHGQSAAHDLLRDAVMRLLAEPPDTPGLTRRAIAAVFGSITVTSTAPGELARTVEGGTRGLTAGQQAKRAYEANRNEAKLRQEELVDALDEDERDFVNRHAEAFMASTRRAGDEEDDGDGFADEDDADDEDERDDEDEDEDDEDDRMDVDRASIGGRGRTLARRVIPEARSTSPLRLVTGPDDDEVAGEGYAPEDPTRRASLAAPADPAEHGTFVTETLRGLRQQPPADEPAA